MRLAHLHGLRGDKGAETTHRSLGSSALPDGSRVRRDKNVPNERPTGAQEDPAHRSPLAFCHKHRKLISTFSDFGYGETLSLIWPSFGFSTCVRCDCAYCAVRGLKAVAEVPSGETILLVSQNVQLRPKRKMRRVVLDGNIIVSVRCSGEVSGHRTHRLSAWRSNQAGDQLANDQRTGLRAQVRAKAVYKLLNVRGQCC